MKKTGTIYETITVRPGGDRDYPIIIGENLGHCVAEQVARISSKCKVLVVTDKNVAALHLDALKSSLKKHKIESDTEILPAGERYKTFKSYWKIISHLAEMDDLKDLVVVALGGGVVGDIAGFAASSYRRGISCIQVPTTLLSAVDSSVGGKTGIDLPEGKNLVGAFYQPRSVVVELSYLKTLPVRELRAGLAEVLKYGYIMDEKFSRWNRANIENMLSLDMNSLSVAVKKSCELKAKVVQADERDSKGVRAILNFGHTFAHAIETACGYSRYRHGEAVGIGMLCAARLSANKMLLSETALRKIENDLLLAGLPSKIKGATREQLLANMKKDKKSSGGKLKFVLLDKIGHAFVDSNVSENDIVSSLAL